MSRLPPPPVLRPDDDEARSERSSAIELSLRDAGRRRARFWTRRRLHALDIASGIVASSALAGLGMVVVDRIFRPEWDISWGDHWLGAPILFVSAAVLLGLAFTLLVLSERAVASAFPYSSGRRDVLRVTCHAVMAGMLCWSTAVWTFSGKAVSATIFGRIGPPLFVMAVMAFVVLVSWLGFRVDRQVARRRYGKAWILGSSYLVLSALAFWADMNLYVSLYERLHTLLEVSAFGLLVAAFQALGFVGLRRFPKLRLPVRSASAALVALAVVFVGYRPLRTYTDGLLTHAWVNQVYVGRTLKRAQLVELTLDGGQSLEMARVHHIAARFGLTRTRLEEGWSEPAPVPSPESLALRGGRKNIVFFYVDTLRNDVARDPALMPHLARFASESLDFRAAYSSGSDTLRALPALTSGTYFTQQQADGDLLGLAAQAEHESVLVAARSPTEFLEKHRPSFAFERRITIDDYPQGKEVWGYGADRPTAHTIVDQGIEELGRHGPEQPFLLWMLHFDQHAWTELPDAYIREKQAEFAVPSEGALDLRYRVVARAIDEEFGRFLAALEGSGHRDDTVVVFVSDHGEGLGRDGFWVHSVFLWEDLIHVPLVIRAPGVPPRQIDTPVSLVDVAPTLAPYFELEERPELYHGVDLFEYALGHTPARRLPILLRGANRDRLERIGIVDSASGRKLILGLEAALPELYAVPGDRLEAKNLARFEPARVKQLLTQLGRSPVFPRAGEDFDLLLDRGRVGLPGQEPYRPRPTSAPPVARAPRVPTEASEESGAEEALPPEPNETEAPVVEPGASEGEPASAATVPVPAEPSEAAGPESLGQLQ